VRRLHLTVDVEERSLETRGCLRPERRLPGPHEADENEVPI
jgi:hypothetical protein